MIKIEDHKELHSKHGVYAIKNTINNKWYFGSSIRPKGGIGSRITRHLWELRTGQHHNRHLQNSWDKHGESSFEIYLVEECNLEDARKKEKEWIVRYEDSVYNICPDTTHPGGIPWTEERRLKQSGENHHMYGKHHTEESKALISKSRTGITAGENHHLYGIGHTEVSKNKMSESHKLLTGDKNPFFGKKHTKETKRTNSEKKKQWLKENGHPRISLSPKGEYKGVYKSGKKWIASIRISGKLKSLGTFKEAEEAAKNYDYHAKKFYPPNAYLNFPDYDYSNFFAKKNFALG